MNGNMATDGIGYVCMGKYSAIRYSMIFQGKSVGCPVVTVTWDGVKYRMFDVVTYIVSTTRMYVA